MQNSLEYVTYHERKDLISEKITKEARNAKNKNKENHARDEEKTTPGKENEQA